MPQEHVINCGRGFTFGSWCSGIEAASEAWLPLGWSCAYVAEIEPFPCAYLAQTYGAGRPRYMPRPEDVTGILDQAKRRTAIKTNNRLSITGALPNLGDISQLSASDLPRVDIIAAGFPCQDFSIAGLRASLGGNRGNLSTIGVRLILEAADLGLVRGAVLEQVPDVLNTADNAWGNIMGALVGADHALKGLEHGGKWPRTGMVAGPRSRVAWRILDAQHFGLAQRRERVWAVVDFGDGPDPAAVLFERKGVLGNHSSRRGAGQDVAPTLAGGARQRGGFSYDDIPAVAEGAQRRAAFGGNNTSGPIDVATARTASQTASGRQDFESETFIVDGHGSMAASDVAPPLRATGADAGHGSEAMVAHSLRGEGFDASEDGTGRGTPIVPVAIPINSDATRDGKATTPSADAAGRVRLRDPGLGVGEDGDPMFTVQTGSPHAVAYSIMPQNSGKDYKAREVDVAQPLMAAGPAGGNQGGDYIVQPVAFRTTGNDGAYETGNIVGSLTTATDPNTSIIAFSCKDHGADAGELAPTMRAMGHAGSHANADGQVAVAYGIASDALDRSGEAACGTAGGRSGLGITEGLSPTLKAKGPGAVAFSLRGREGRAMPECEEGDLSPALRAAEGGSTRPFIAFDETQITSAANRSNPQPGDPCHPLTGQGRPPTLAQPMAVRRITVVEAERLQGFRDNATLIDWPSANRKGVDLAETIAYLIGHGFSPERAAELAQTPDGPRYKAIGNSWPVPVARWIGEGIAQSLSSREAAA